MNTRIQNKYQELGITNIQLKNEIMNIIKEAEPKEIAYKLFEQIRDIECDDNINNFTFAIKFSRLVYVQNRFLKYSGLKMPDFSNFPFRKYKKIKDELGNIIQSTIHIRGYELPRWNNIDRINNNLELRIKYMRNKITEKDFKFNIQKKDKEHQLKTEFTNILTMYITCMTDLIYRINDNIDEYDKILEEMHQLRKYTNECFSKVFNVFGSKKKQHIGENFDYRYSN
jgi:hypothetical protein